MLKFAAMAGRTKSELWPVYLKLIVGAQFLTSLGFGLVGPFMPLFIQELGGFDGREAALWAGILSGLNGMVMFLVSPMWGAWSDWFGHKRNVLRASFATAGIMGLTAVLGNVTQLIISRVIMGGVSGVFPAMMGLSGSIVPRAKLVHAIGMLQGISSLGMMVGPVVGGMIVDRSGYGPAFLLSGLIIALGGVLVLTLVQEDFHKPKGTAHNLKGLGAEMKGLTSTPGMPRALLLVSLVQMAPNLVFPVLPLTLAAIAVQSGLASVGLVFTVMGLAATAAAFGAGALSSRLGLRWLFALGGATGAVGAFAMGFVGSIPLAIGFSVLLGLSVGALASAASALVGSLAPSTRQGSAFGLVQSANAIGFGFGPLIGGVVGSLFGLRVPFMIEGVLFLLAPLLVASIPKEAAQSKTALEPVRP
ncbi:MAG: MFS transporter [Chloroflexi bacterium]|nr:MFS transporter [Chloroflexota bacterium]